MHQGPAPVVENSAAMENTAEQHQRIQMVLLRERGMMQPLIAAGPCRRESCSLENADLEKRGAIT